MIQMLNRKMPTKRAAWCFVVLSSALSLLFALRLTGPLTVLPAITFAAVGLLSIPRMTYPRVLLLAFAAGLLPAVLGVLLTRSIAFAIASFAFAPAAALLVLTIRRRTNRSAGILLVTLSLAVFFSAALLAALYEYAGSLSVEVFKQLYAQFKAVFIENTNAVLAQNASLLEGLTVDDAFLTALYQTFLAILPGVFVCVLWVIAWLSTAFLRWIFKSYVYGADRFADWPVTAHRPTAWIFLASILISVLPLSDTLSIIPLIATNLYLILLPVFTVVGCRAIKEQFLRTPGCGCFPLVFLGFSVVMFPAPLILLSTFGALRTVAPKRIQPPTPPADTQNPTDDQGGDPR